MIGFLLFWFFFCSFVLQSLSATMFGVGSQSGQVSDRFVLNPPEGVFASPFIKSVFPGRAVNVTIQPSINVSAKYVGTQDAAVATHWQELRNATSDTILKARYEQRLNAISISNRLKFC